METKAFKANTSLNHQMGLKPTLAISKQEFFNAVMPT
jgi:hypothetical protein